MISQEIIIQKLIRFGLAFIPAMMGIVLHELAHGWVAWRLGDPTAKAAGRITLNPIRHIDPTGLGVFAFTAIFTNFIIGWAKPVPVQAGYFKNRKTGMLLVSIAGPLTNFILALLFALLFKIILSTIQPFDTELPKVTLIILQIASLGILINCMLGVFNLLPLPPLDGSHIISAILPDSLAKIYWGITKYSMLIILVLLFTRTLGKIILPILYGAVNIICAIVGLNPNLII